MRWPSGSSTQIVDSGGLPDNGEFPMEFTDTHDLAIDYLMQEAIGYQRQDIADLEAVAATPNLSPAAAARWSPKLSAWPSGIWRRWKSSCQSRSPIG